MMDGQHVDTDELNGCLIEGHTPESTIKFYDLTKKEYSRVVNSKKNIIVRMGKKSPAYEHE